MLTAVEAMEIRRQTGYSAVPAAPSEDFTAVLAALSPEAEAVLRVTFLPSLTLLELSLWGASDTLDTKKAAVWERNALEVPERTSLYRAQRLALCRFLGIPPGPAIYDMVITSPGADGGSDGSEGGLALPPAVLVV